MRKRSEVGRAAAQEERRQQDLDAVKPLEQTPLEANLGLRHFACPKCGTKQSASIIEAQGGKCIRCGEPIAVGAAEADPWKLRPESVATAKTEPAPPPAQEVPRQPMGGEVPFTELLGSLERHGFAVTMQVVAQWTPEQRGHARTVCEAFDKGQVANVQSWLMALRSRVPAWAEAPMGEKLAQHVRSEPGDSMAKGARVVDVGPMPDIKVPDRSSIDPSGGDVGETVSAAWGEEKFTPVKNSYSVCTVGPFVGATKVRPGETRAQATLRVLEELREVARVERDRKLKEFVQKLRSLSEELHGAGAN